MKEMNNAKKALFVRALCGLAWADERIQSGERRFIERVADQMGLGADYRAQIEEWLAEPMPAVDASRLLRDLTRGVLDRGERASLLGLLRQLAEADGDLSEPERDFLASIERQGSVGAGRRALLSRTETRR